MKVSIGKAAKELGVARETLRRWERDKKIIVERTPKGHRRYDLSQIRGLVSSKKESSKRTLAYARVSSAEQKEDLKRQLVVLESYCACRGWEYEVVQDLGSGLNYSKKGLKKLIEEICSGTVDRLLIVHKDRLLRFGAELIFALCEYFGTEVVIMNTSHDSNFEDDLTQDVLEIITVFSARLYDARSRKNKKIIEALQTVANEI